jgi:hypothetical protein
MSNLSQPETSEPKEKAVTAWVMAALAGGAAAWVGWMLGWPWVVDMNHPDFNPIIILEGLLLAVLAWNVVQALRWTRRARQFGASMIDIDGRTPVPLGGAFSGRVRTAQTIRAKGDFRLVLTCLDIHERKNMASSSTTSPHRTEAYPVWTAEQTLPAATDSARGLLFRFDLPASVGDKPVAPIRAQKNAYFSGSISINIPGLRRIFTHKKPPVARVWTLVVTAPTDGPDYRAEFTVPLADF